MKYGYTKEFTTLTQCPLSGRKNMFLTAVIPRNFLCFTRLTLVQRFYRRFNKKCFLFIFVTWLRELNLQSYHNYVFWYGWLGLAHAEFKGDKFYVNVLQIFVPRTIFLYCMWGTQIIYIPMFFTQRCSAM